MRDPPKLGSRQGLPKLCEAPLEVVDSVMVDDRCRRRQTVARMDPPSPPSDVLTARAAATGPFDSLVLALGVVALIVGAIGVANTMVVSVLERRSEVGLRRALGATEGQIRAQFLGESVLLALVGGVVGILAGAAATVVYPSAKGWDVAIPLEAWSSGIGSAVLIGALAGLLPAVRASRMPPTVALRTV